MLEEVVGEDDGWMDGEENKNILVNNLKFMFNLTGKRKPCVCTEWIAVDLCRARQRSDKVLFEFHN